MIRKSRPCPLILLCLFWCLPCLHLLAGESALPAIQAAKLHSHLEFLASDELVGRDSGEPGLEVAAEYIANVYRQYGLEPAGDNGTYFQHFAVPGGAAFGRYSGVRVQLPGGEELVWNAGAEVEAFGFDAPGVVEGPIVFAGYGITTAKGENVEYDDYEGIDVKGKVLLILRFVPRFGSGGPFRGRRSPHAPFVAKLRNAKNHGAAGVIIVTPPGTPDEDVYGLAHRASPRQPTMPAVVATQAAVDRLLRSRGVSLKALEEKIDASLEPQSFELEGVRARFATTRRHLRLRNVAGRLPGKDPALAEEVVVIGGHYDHIGRFGNQVAQGNLGKIHNGADDNASGIAGILELARVFSGDNRPKRSLTFICFSGEEIGLLGSRHWVEAKRGFVTRGPTRATAGPKSSQASLLWEEGTLLRATGRFEGDRVEVKSLSGTAGWVQADALVQVSGPDPLHRVAAMINLDMIGRAKDDGSVSVIGAQSSDSFAALLQDLSQATGVNAQASRGMSGGGSDHANFLRHGIPVLFFFTGMHRQYNTPEDDVPTINVKGEANLLTLVGRAVRRLADATEAPRFNPAALASRGRGGRQGPRLGVQIDTTFPDGVKVVSTVDGSIAAKAGVQPGDIILSLGVKSVDRLQDLLAVLDAGPHGKVALKVRRGNEEKVLEAAFPAPSSGGFRVRFGSVPDYAFAEKGVRFDDIRPGTPAARAGVKPGDILVRWGDKDVEDVEGWTALLGRHKPGDEVAIEVLRGKERVKLKVKLEGR